MGMPHRCLARAALCVLAWMAGTAWADAWPDFRAPPDARLETVAADMVLNGKPCRMVRFQVHASDDEVAGFYRTEFGPRHVENRVRDDRVIATRQGGYFVTVQLHLLDAQTVQGTAITTLVEGKPVASAVLVDTKALFPVDTQVVSSVQTNDAARHSLVVVGLNHNSLRANRDHVLDAMAERGFRLTTQAGPPGVDDGKSVSMQLESPAEEASVAISDAGPYRSVVIHRIRADK